MIWVAAGALGLSGLVATLLVGSLRWQSRAHERERQQWQARQDTLVNQLCHVSGRAWTLPPLDGRVLPSLSDPDRDLEFVSDPDQLPDWE